MGNQIYFFTFLASLVVSLILTPAMGRIALKYGVVDKPAHRKTHSSTIPYLGGVAVFLALTLTMVVIGLAGFHSGWLTPVMAAKGGVILFCSLGVMGVGLLDDATPMGPMKKLLGQIFFVTLFVLFGFRLEVFGIPGFIDLGLPVLLTVPLTIFWILAMINAVNMVDGSDGLAGMVTASGMVILTSAALSLEDNLVAILALAALGAILGFLFFNWRPARIYLGDAGSNGLGMFLSASLIALGNPTPLFLTGPLQTQTQNPFPYHFLVLTLMNFYPVLEVTLSVVRRLVHGKPIYRADRGHIHHRLMKKSFTAPQIALVASFLMFLPGLAALSVIHHNYGQAAWLLALTGLVLGISLSLLNFLNFLQPTVLEHTRPYFRIADHFIAMQRLKLSLTTTREEILALVGQTCQEFGVSRCRLILAPDEKGQGGLDYYKEWTHKQPAEYLDFLFSEGSQPAKFTDRCRLPVAGTGAAEWTFDLHDLQDEDLDVDFRVLMNEFMQSVLEAASRWGKDQATKEYRNEFPPALKLVSTHSHTLHKRNRYKLKLRSVPHK